MKTILVVEDETSVSDFILSFLEDEGYQVLTALNGLEGLEQLSKSRPDLILSDMMMPHMDGLGFCQELQGNEAHSTIPIILMSAALNPKLRESCECAAFIEKPFDLEILLTTIVGIIGASA